MKPFAKPLSGLVEPLGSDWGIYSVFWLVICKSVEVGVVNCTDKKSAALRLLYSELARVILHTVFFGERFAKEAS